MKTAERSRLLMVEISINGLSVWIARGWPNVKFDSTPEGSFWARLYRHPVRPR